MSKGAKDADRLTPDADTWPEQEIVSAWLSKYGILIPFKQQLDLQEQLTKLRHSLSQEAVRDEALAVNERRLSERRWPSSSPTTVPLGRRQCLDRRSTLPTEKMLIAALAEHDRQPAFITLRERYAGIWRAMVSARSSEQKNCPHAAPFRYCETCVADPCPIGLGSALKREPNAAGRATRSPYDASGLKEHSGD